MAPVPTATANRPMAQPSKTRYFKGKAPELAPDSDSDEDNDDQEEIQLTKPKFKAATKVLPVDPSLVAGGAGRVITDVGGIGKAGTGGIGMKMELGGAKIGGPQTFSKPVKEETSEEEESEEEEEEEKPAPRFAKPPVPGDESSEYETDSEEESEEEKKPAFRPVFIRKDQRGMTQEKAAAEAEARLKAEEELQAQRKADSKDLAGETIRRELAEREVTDIQPDVDDTDGLDPAAEFDAWQARELRRLVRDKEAQAARDLEKEEIERRRALPEDQRLREDMEFAQATRDREKGEMGFLQKYYHKGAFHQDDDLLKRDYTAATESAVDMSNLPSVMQVRDFGKRSRTKYTHLVDQDTSQGGWGAAKPVVPAGTPGQFGQATMGQGQGQFAQGCWNCGGDHMRKDCPNNNLNDPMAQFGLGSSSNAGGLGGSSYGRGGGPPQDYGTRERQPNRYAEDGRERRFDEQRRAGGSDRHQDRGYDRDRSRDEGRSRDDRRRERSRSPERRRDGDARRDERDRDRRRDERDDRDRDRRRDDRDRDRDRARDRNRDGDRR